MVRNEMYNFQTRLVQFKDEKKLKIYIIVRIELSINKNTQRPETKTMHNLLDISEVTRRIYLSTKSS